MYRGTTPTNTFKTDVDLTQAQAIYITYSQQNRPVIEKANADITVTAEELQVTLTQEETLRLANREVEVQVRARFADGTAIASNIVRTTAERILKDGVI